MASYAELLLRDSEGRAIKPEPHHILWLRLMCDTGIKRLLLIAPPESAKPVDVDALVLMGDGSRKRLRDVVVGDTVVTHEGRPRTVLAVHEQGVLPVVTITTHAGRTVRAAADHPFLTPDGWKNAGDLRVGEVLAGVPHPQIGARQLPDETFRLAGYFVGDGCTTAYARYAMNADITCNDPTEEADIRWCASVLGFTVTKTVVAGRESAPKIGLGGGVRKWLREAGLAGKDSRQKRVPDWVFTATGDQIAHFVGAYFACDGSASLRGPGKQRLSIDIGSVNRPLLEDVQHLLLRLGVASRVRRHDTRYRGEPREAYTLTVGTSDAIARFIATVPVYHAKGAFLKTAPVFRQHFEQRFVPDQIVSITVGDAARCRCLSVEDDRSFTANDLVVHNTTWVLAFCGVHIGVFPEEPILVGSVSGEVAERRVLSLRSMVETPEWQEAFPGVLPVRGKDGLKWETFQWSVAPGGRPFPGRVHPTCTAAGTKGTVIGSRARIAIGDDLLDYENTRTEYQRQETYNWAHSSLLSRVHARHGRQILIGNAWHHDDLYARFQNPKSGWVVCHIPVMSPTKEVYATLTYPDNWKGEVLGTPIPRTVEPYAYLTNTIPA